MTPARQPVHPNPHVDYGTIDLDDPAVQLALEQDHRSGVHHYGLPCCEPEPKL